MAQQLSTNTFGTAKWIVSADATQGTHTTIAGALTSATSGDTIFIRPGTYTENLTLKAGVNLTAYPTDGSTQNVKIIGKLSYSGSGIVSISGVTLQTNSDFLLSVTGSNVSEVYLTLCYLNITNSTGIEFTTSNASARIRIIECQGDLTTSGIAVYTSSSTGSLIFIDGFFNNSGSSTTVSNNSAGQIGFFQTNFSSPISTSLTGTLQIVASNLSTASNAVSITTAGTGSALVISTYLATGSGACISVGSGTTVNCYNSTFSSSGANAISGAGTLNYGGLDFTNTKVISTSTTNPIAYAVPQGGTGNTSQTAYSLVCGGTTTTGNFQAIAPVATGQVLVSSGVSALPAFSATPSVTSITLGGGTALGNYLEGTFTPTLNFGGATTGIAYTVQLGRYTRIGNRVLGYFTFTLSNKGSATGSATITGFPIATQALGSFDQDFSCVILTYTAPASSTYNFIEIGQGTTTGAVYAMNALTGGVTQLTDANFNNTTSIRCSFQYSV